MPFVTYSTTLQKTQVEIVDGEEYRSAYTVPVVLCFRHAVHAALAYYDVDTNVAKECQYCDVCSGDAEI